jgi:hypothetical protein
MKKQTFYLQKPQDDPFLVGTYSIIIWINYIDWQAIASGDLVCLLQEFYFPN